jgi:hypothetical protein
MKEVEDESIRLALRGQPAAGGNEVPPINADVFDVRCDGARLVGIDHVCIDIQHSDDPFGATTDA